MSQESESVYVCGYDHIPKYLITYDCGYGNTTQHEVCEECFKKDEFSDPLCIIKKTVIE